MPPPRAELLCIGDISVDTLVSIDHLPRRDEKQWARLIGDFPGGMAANVAYTYTRLGGTARLLARVGRDAHGAFSMGYLRGTDIDVSGVVEVDDPTFWTMSLVDATGERSMIEFASDAIHPPWSSVGDGDGARVAYTIGSETTTAVEAFERLQGAGVTTAVDADYAEIESEDRLRRLLAVVEVFFCNAETASHLTGGRAPLESAEELASHGPAVVVVTLGAGGAVAFDRQQGGAEVGGLQVEVVDSTGAGDCFAGSFLFSRTRGWPLEAGLELANVMAAISTTAFGCQGGVPTVNELLGSPLAAGKSFVERLGR